MDCRCECECELVQLLLRFPLFRICYTATHTHNVQMRHNFPPFCRNRSARDAWPRTQQSAENRNCDFVCISILVLSAAIQIHNTLIGTSADVRATWSTWCCARYSWTDVNIAQWYQLLINRLAFCRLIYKFVSNGIVRIEGRSCKIPHELQDWLEFKYARRVNPRRRRLWKTVKSRSTSSRENRGHVALVTQMDERAAVHYISMSSRFDKIRDWLPFHSNGWHFIVLMI